ncbi:uncharacterized protein LOC108217491 [Daucus carota subsp. sativus]|uniref:uncharacterized protein LOC108217491 n=1 Tax=Daucus carota subsp. sativus TaxID=79200 RepID=UPI0007F0061C|nr:PREDICTED: uncharacterized protein LOC108217491 [Daucus carota subsp. sativus]
MSNLTKLEFNALDISGNNYLTWILDAEIHLNAMGLGDTIKGGNIKSEQDKAKAMIFLRHHLHEGLKTEYFTVKDPSILWKELKERYDHQKTITSQLKLCGENVSDKDMLEKTYSTFHANNMLLQQQYRERGFTKYSELISVLLLAEQNNELLMKNHQARPTGSTPFPEVNVVTTNDSEQNKQFGRGRGHGRGFVRGRGRARGRGFGHGRSYTHQPHSNFKKKSHHLKWTRNEEKPKGSTVVTRTESICHRCGMKGHWSRTCRTAKHLVDLYQASLKGVETNFTEKNDPLEIAHLEAHLGSGNQVDPSSLTHMEVGDFFEDGIVEMTKFDGGEN